MQVDPEQQARDEADYANAFNDIDPQMSAGSDEGEGAGLQAAVDIAGNSQQQTETSPDNAGQTATEAAGDQPGASEGEVRDDGGEAADTGTPDPEPDDDLEKERQRLRSWEGRLKKQQAELEAASKKKQAPVDDDETPAAERAEPASSEALEQLSNEAAGDGNTELGEAAQQAADAIESGELTPEQAMAQLAEDFGEDFVRMIAAIAGAKAKEIGSQVVDERVSQVAKSVTELADDVQDTKTREHFRAIESKHPDYLEVGGSDGFKQYLAGLPEKDRADAERVVKGGTAKEVVKLLDGYKAKQAEGERQASEKAAAEEAARKKKKDEEMAAAEGVRSSGVSLPKEPKPAATTYEQSWDEFN